MLNAMTIDSDHLRQWLGRVREDEDEATLAPARALAAVLDLEAASDRRGDPAHVDHRRHQRQGDRPCAQDVEGYPGLVVPARSSRPCSSMRSGVSNRVRRSLRVLVQGDAPLV